MQESRADQNLVAACGLYCGACRKHLAGKCPGCRENQRAGWCHIRSCCAESQIASCAACTKHADPADCGKFNSLIGKVFGLLFNSDRRACVLKIRELGPEAFAAFMAERRLQTLPRRGPRP